MKAISGLLHAERGQLTKGSIEFGGERLDHLAAHDIVVRGITQVFEGRRVFENLTVEENLVVGGHVQASMQRVRQGIDLVFDYFPRCSRNVGASTPATCPAANSRCWR